MRHMRPNRKHRPGFLFANLPGPAGTGAVLPRLLPLSAPSVRRAWRGAACALAAAFALLLGAEAAEAQTTPPTIVQAFLLSDNKVRLTFDKDVYHASKPAGSAFRVVSKVFNHREQTHVGTGTVDIAWRSVTVTLDRNGGRLSTAADFTVTYTKPASNALRGNDGGEVAGFSWSRTLSGPGRFVYSTECRPFDSNYLAGYWYVTYKYGFGRGDRRIPCDMAKPGWIYDQRPHRFGQIMWVYAGHPGTSGGPPAPPVDRPHEAVTYLVPDRPDHRAVRGTDGACYREERSGGRWHRSVSYGSGAEACRKAAWNTYYRAQHPGVWRPMVDPAGGPDAGTFPSGAPPAAPLLESATVLGKTLRLTFNKTLDTGSTPAPGAFYVTVGTARRSVASGGVAIAGKTVTLTLASAVSDDGTVKVRYTRPSSNPLRDTDGFTVETFADQAVSNNTIWSATLTVKEISSIRGCKDGTPHTCATGLTSNTFVLGGVTHRFLQISTVQTDVNRVLLGVTLDKAASRDWTLHVDNGQVRFADATLVEGDKSASWSNFNTDWELNQKVSLRLTTGDSGDSGGSGLTAGEPPWVTEVSVASDAGADKTYGLGDTIRVRVDFVEPVEVTGTPRLRIDMDPAEWGEKWAAYESGSGTGSLVFAHTVVQPNFSTQGIAVLANSLETGGGTIRAGGADAKLAHDGLAHDASHKVDWQRQPESAGPVGTSGTSGASEASAASGPPTVTGVRVVSDPGADDTYMLGETIRIRATFSAAVNVTGSPRLSIDMSPAAWGTKQAAYASGGGTKSLTFAYTVVEPNYSTQGIAVLANSLALNGGAIRSAAANANAELAHTGLGHDSGHKVDWRPSISVADARATEAAGATVAFTVSLSRAFTTAAHRVTVDYATADGTAKAGADYTATSGTLTFAAGETVKTVNVAVLDDGHDEGEETFTLRLSNATGARIGDGEATGTIANSDAMPRAWLSRFGRAVAGQVLDAVGARMDGPSSAPTRVTLGGQEVLLGDAAREALGGGPSLAGRRGGLWKRGEDSPPRETSMSELLLASSFHLASAGGGNGSGSGRWSLWGRGARTGFDGREGALTLEGDVTTGLVGADYESGRVLVGVALALSSGDGSYEESGMRGEVESSLAGVYPYLRYAVSERLAVWGAAGLGEGDLTLKPGGAAQVETDLSMSMAAAGARGALLTMGGLRLALRSDLAFVRAESDAAAGLAAAEADTSRLRLALEGSTGEMGFAAGALTPTVELGLRYDGGDAETGAGLEVGGGLRYASGRLTLALSARGLLAHEANDYEEWGVSASVRFSPNEGGRGLSLRAASTWGAAAGGVDRLWSQAPGGFRTGTFEPGAGVDAEAGYGFDFRRGLLTPYTGVSLSQNAETWRAGARWKIGPAFDVALEASLREPANGEDPESGVLLKGSRRW